MKELFLYLLREKRGILTTIFWTGGLLAGCTLFFEFMTRMDYWSYIQLEEMSIIAVVIGFVFVCNNAFRFGTANGVSRSTVIKTLLLSVLLMSVMQAAVNACMLVLRGLSAKRSSLFYHWSSDLLYIHFANRVSVGKDAYMKIMDELVPKLLLWESLLYFGIVCLMLTLCCFWFALFRKYGTVGLLCGIVVPFTLIYKFQMFIQRSDQLSRSLYDLYYYKEPVHLTPFDLYEMYEQPKIVPLIVTFTVLIMFAAAGFAICMKHTDIRKKYDL